MTSGAGGMTSGAGGTTSGAGGMVISGLGGAGGSGPSTTLGPLRVSTVNRRYFADRNGKIVYLTGSHTWGNFHDRGLTDPPAPFDFNLFLDFLVSHNHNFIRLWTWEQPHSWNNNLDQLKRYFTPFPWQRTGPGTANDGKPQFDLTKLDQSYFDRMRARVMAAAARGVYVAVMLFDGWDVANACNQTDGGFPYGTGNNVNGISVGSIATACTDIQTLAVPAITTIQEAYVQKLIDTVNDLDNVLYEIANEPTRRSDSVAVPLDRFRQAVRSREAQPAPGRHDHARRRRRWAILASHADWISPVDPNLLSDGTKVVLNDTDHSYYWTTLESNGPDSSAPVGVADPHPGRVAAVHGPVPRGLAGAQQPDRQHAGPDVEHAARLAREHAALRRQARSRARRAVGEPGVDGVLPRQPRDAVPRIPAVVRRLHGHHGRRHLQLRVVQPQDGRDRPAGSMTIAGGSVSFTPPFTGDAVLLLSR